MMEYTWRWFGPNDRISFQEIKQTGATGIVTALHHIPVGEVWSLEEIAKRKQLIQDAGFTWSVVESVPVHEDIKRQSGKFQEKIENYKTTLKNLGKSGIRTVCYNFMPILDWSRTNLIYKFSDNSEVTHFEFINLVAFDIHILKRENAEKSYPDEVVEKAHQFYKSLSTDEADKLTQTVLLGLPGSLEAFTLDGLKNVLKTYESIDSSRLKSNLFHFLQEIVPVAESSGIYLAIHPDDPPWSLLGLPRIVSTDQDIDEILRKYDSVYNGITLCTGSLGAGYFNDVAAMAAKFSHRINFAHLRNVSRDHSLNFHENYFFDGDVDMYGVMRALVKEQDQRKRSGRENWRIPMRPDHGNQMLGDLGKENYPGYSLYGRMKSLAEIRGLEVGVTRSLLADKD
jgi:mannonate dehydratase